MAKSVNDVVLDAALDKIATADIITICTTEPTTYAEATATNKLADMAVTPGHGNGDFTKADGDVSGRKLTIAQQDDLVIDASGTAAHVALCDSATSTLLYVTTCSNQPLVNPGFVTIPAWKIEFADPS